MEGRETARRPDPEALLALADEDSRGKLTVFLGAAPGVGKTYAMLDRARHLMATGVDIVVGLVETHGRSETALLLADLEALPRKSVDYRGRTIEEFDIDAALARRPKVILVDEMAHTNVEGSRHPKRFQDIEELIQAGIDVWTTLNIQHLESLSDVVAKITGVAVREIVPDIALKKADEVILVDLPPADLIERLKQGKVYLPDNAERAMEGFFRPANLTALRELALRRAADRVDDQMVDFLRRSAIEGPWATGERLLVLVGPDPLSEKVVRTASRLASGLNAPWLVISITRPGATVDSGRLEETMRLAERLGAETRRVTAEDFVAEIMRTARRENVTQIVVGRLPRSLFARLTRRSLPDRLIGQAGDINVHVVSADVPLDARPGFNWRTRSNENALEAIGFPLAAVVAITLVGKAITAILTLQNVAMLYLVAVVVCGVVSGRRSAVFAALLSFVAYNFFFIQPVHTFAIDKPHEFFALFVFLAAAIFTAELSGRLREQAERARSQEKATQALYDFSRKLSGAARLDNVLDATAAHLYAETGKGTALLTPRQDGELIIGTVWPPDLAIDPTAMMAARWAFEKSELAGFSTATLPQVPWQFRPILTARKPVAVVGLLLGENGPLRPGDEQIVHGVLEQAAVAIDRARLFSESARRAALEESDRLHTALFASLSHDLKTPLATISGAATSLRDLGDKMEEPTRRDLLTSIEEEASRLGRFVANLFDMTRLEAGTLKPNLETIDIPDVVDGALQRVRKVYPGRIFDVSLAADLPSIEADAHLLGQVLFNLLENACKYGGEGNPISIFGRLDGNEVAISVTDQGKGIPEKDLEKIFEKFYRRQKSDGRAAGTGLGLSIAKGFIEAMGGTIKAESPAVRRRGTRFIVRLPVAREPRSRDSAR
jgi:two-component system sensor histidine kinase KdpD